MNPELQLFHHHCHHTNAVDAHRAFSVSTTSKSEPFSRVKLSSPFNLRFGFTDMARWDGLYLKIDRKFGWLPRLTIERKLEPMLIQNLLYQRQPDPLPVIFSAEKRREQIGAHRR